MEFARSTGYCIAHYGRKGLDRLRASRSMAVDQRELIWPSAPPAITAIPPARSLFIILYFIVFNCMVYRNRRNHGGKFLSAGVPWIRLTNRYQRLIRLS